MLLLGAPFAEVREASACSWPNCGPPVRLFQPDQHVPGNLIRFKVTTADPGPLELRAADGQVVPARISTMGGDRVFAPDAPQVAGQTLTLHYRPVCHFPTAESPGVGTFSFMVAAPTELILQPRTLTMTEKGIGFAGEDRTMVVRYEHTPADRWASASHLTDTTWTIAGRPFGPYRHPGAVVSHCRPPRTGWFPDSCGFLGAVPPGEHLLKAVTRIVGVEQEFVAELKVDTRCDQVLRIDPLPPEGGPDGGAQPSPPGEDATVDQAVADAAPPGVTGPGAIPHPGVAGCSMSGPTDPGGGPAFAAAALLLMALARRVTTALWPARA